MIRNTQLFYSTKGGLCFALIILIGLLTLPQKADAQATQAFRLAEGFVRIAEPGQLADTLSVLGDINAPGRYIVPRGTRVHELISHARGPVPASRNSAQLDWTKTRVEVSISRYNNEIDSEQINMFIYQYSEPFPEGLRDYVLKSDDIVSVEIKQKPGFLDWLRVFSTLVSATATTIIVIDRLSN